MQLDDLMARMTALERMIRDLEQELARSNVGGFRSMRDSRQCPACRGVKLLHIPQAQEVTHGGAVTLGVHHEKGFWGPKIWGPLEYFVCRGCYLVESHVTDLAGVEPDGKSVISIDPAPDGPSDGPFR